MKRGALWTGLALLPAGWVMASGRFGMTGHMAGHMVAVAVAAPCLAIGIAGTRSDPAARFPAIVNPLAMSLLELVVVWLWHLPSLRAAVAMHPAALVAEQASFLVAGLLLWSAALGSAQGGATERRLGGIAALLLTSMHMTLLGALIGLAPRPLYPAHMVAHGLSPLADQQLGGVVMLTIGAASYFIGGLAMLAGILRHRSVAA